MVLGVGFALVMLTSSPRLPMMPPTTFWTAPVAESTYDLRVEELVLLLLADMMMVCSWF
jgi:hypothetical protein